MVTKENADYIYFFSENDAVKPSSSKSWSTLFNVPGIDYLGGESSGGGRISPTPTTRQSNYVDALRLSLSATSSFIDPIARSANIQLEDIYIPDEKRKGASPMISPRLLATKTSDSLEKSDDKGDVSTKIMMDNKYKLEKTDVEVTSKDSKLSKDANELYKFFMSHNDRPEMAISIHGYRTEEKETGGTTRMINGSGGYEHEKRDVKLEEVQDFNFTIDLTDHILKHGDIYTIPSKDDDDYDIKDGKDIMQVLEEYCKNRNGKEIKMRKVIIWEYESLTKAIVTIIRQQNYYNNIKISYPLRNNSVKVQSTSALYNIANNKWINLFCLLTCLWIIFWPIWCLYRKIYPVQIKSEFRMNISTKEWFESNISDIINNVKS